MNLRLLKPETGKATSQRHETAIGAGL